MRNPETAKRLADAMNMKKMSAKELSDKSGVSESSISQYLHGLFAPRNRTAAKLASVLEVNPMWLMGFDVDMATLEKGVYTWIDENGMKKAIAFPSEMKVDPAPNHDFLISMDKITKTMTPDQMRHIMKYAEFIQASTFDVPEDDKKSDE